MALPHSITALANTLTLSSPTTKSQNLNQHHLLPFFSNQKTQFFTKQTRPRSRRNLFLTPARVAAPPSTLETDQSFPETEKEEIEDEFNDENSSSKFSWRDHWYPVSLIEDLNPLLPTPFQLLGREIVLWYDKSISQWVAFDDKCPHRLAPLSVSIKASTIVRMDSDTMLEFIASTIARIDFDTILEFEFWSNSTLKTSSCNESSPHLYILS